MDMVKIKRYTQIRTSLGGNYYIQFDKENAHKIVRFESIIKEDENIADANNYNSDITFIKAKQGLAYQIFSSELDNDTLFTNSKFKYFFLDSFNKAGSYYKLPSIQESLPELFLSILKATYNVFSKPFTLIKGSLMLRLASLENFALLIFMLFLLFKRSIRLKNLNVLLFNLLFVLILYFIIGLTIPVVGGLIRYKMVGFLLLLISLLMVFDKKIAFND
jgi:hypothetical protein